MTDQHQAAGNDGTDPETPKAQYSDRWLECTLWVELNKLDALHELLYHSADSIDVIGSDAIRGYATLLQGLHGTIRDSLKSWLDFNFQRACWMPRSATVTLEKIEQFSQNARRRARAGDWRRPEGVPIDVPVDELFQWLQESYHGAPAAAVAEVQPLAAVPGGEQ